MLLIVGLGNPGKTYQNNRHNIGFMVIDSLVGKYDLSPSKTQFNALVHTGKIKDKKVIFLKPLTFMNNSGRSVRAAMNFYKIPLDNVIVFHDELDLPNAEIKLKDSGGHGGHNGIRNIIDQLQGDKSFKRLRIGIGHPGKNKDVISYVLKKGSKQERQDLLQSLYDFLDIGEKIIKEGWQKTVMSYHSKKENSDES